MMRKSIVFLACSAALAAAPAASAQTSAASSGATAASTDPSPSMARLQEAAQRLRDSIQAMAQQPPGEQRNQAIDEANRALFDAQRAMIQLPPELRGGPGSASDPNYTKSFERLKQAAQKLRESVQAMAQEPAGPRRDAAASAAREALIETQQAMVMLPPDLRTAGK
jgi:hypothetical protein